MVSPRLFPPKIAVISLVLTCLALTGCLDDDDRCDGTQILDERGVCICKPDFAPEAGGSACLPCAEHEVSDGLACECETGFARDASTATCTALPAGLGVPCDSGTMPCFDQVFDHCQPVIGTEGYCTNTSCASSADCDGGYACDLAASPAVCLRPPSGLAQSCTSSDDCAGYDADYCESFQSNQCLVSGCSLDPDDCFIGWECCDLSALGLAETLCVPETQCPTK